ncbi:MAG TPA: SH3 domain-containing protein [Pyrinomonadaceae bacterium]|nr:SH3 domain-containing protein [Pyrinomonadaceae bacterium]
MKKCPQCNSLYTDDTQYCLNDGTILVGETLPLPSEFTPDEEPTVIRHEPVVIDVSAENASAETASYHLPTAAPVVIERTANSRNYLIFLILGLLLGGSLVLATLLVMRNFYRNEPTNNIEISTSNSNQIQNSQPTKSINSAINQNTTASSKHQLKTSSDDEEFNGRVIALNAYVRSSPDRNSDETDILPIDDRINIERREHSNSPWYYIVCEHGTSGWIHGNTIEYTQ